MPADQDAVLEPDESRHRRTPTLTELDRGDHPDPEAMRDPESLDGLALESCVEGETDDPDVQRPRKGLRMSHRRLRHRHPADVEGHDAEGPGDVEVWQRPDGLQDAADHEREVPRVPAVGTDELTGSDEVVRGDALEGATGGVRRSVGAGATSSRCTRAPARSW